jgi:hypothetical protein
MGQLLKLASQQLSSLIPPRVARQVPVPNPLPRGITNGGDLIDDLEQTLNLRYGEFWSSLAFCHDERENSGVKMGERQLE